MSFSHFKKIIEEGDTAILYVGLSQIYAIEVKPSIKNRHGTMVENTFQTKYGALRVMDLVGKTFGSKVQLTKGYAYVLYPTPELWTQTLPHRTQILYSPDISLIITELEIRPGSVVCEAGTGSGSLSHAILRTIGSKGHLYTCDFHEERVAVAREEFERHGHGSRVTVESRDICENGWSKKDVANAVFLDLPKPWDALEHAVDSVHPNGGRICSFSPCVEQVNRAVEVMRNIGLTEINTVECLQREFQFRSIILPSVEFQKVKTPRLERPDASKTIQSTTKKQKVDAEMEEGNVINVEVHNLNVEKAQNDKSERKDEEKPIEEPLFDNGKCTDDSIAESNKASSGKLHAPQDLIKEHKVRTAIPLLKMQGHTGFLTFATVPPRLKMKRQRLKQVSQVSTINTECAAAKTELNDCDSAIKTSPGEIK